jgi:hypothetical protein
MQATQFSVRSKNIHSDFSYKCALNRVNVFETGITPRNFGDMTLRHRIPRTASKTTGPSKDERIKILQSICRHLANDPGSYHSAEKTPKPQLQCWRSFRAEASSGQAVQIAAIQSSAEQVIYTAVWWQVRTCRGTCFLYCRLLRRRYMSTRTHGVTRQMSVLITGYYILGLRQPGSMALVQCECTCVEVTSHTGGRKCEQLATVWCCAVRRTKGSRYGTAVHETSSRIDHDGNCFAYCQYPTGINKVTLLLCNMCCSHSHITSIPIRSFAIISFY